MRSRQQRIKKEDADRRPDPVNSPASETPQSPNGSKLQFFRTSSLISNTIPDLAARLAVTETALTDAKRELDLERQLNDGLRAKISLVSHQNLLRTQAMKETEEKRNEFLKHYHAAIFREGELMGYLKCAKDIDAQQASRGEFEGVQFDKSKHLHLQNPKHPLSPESIGYRVGAMMCGVYMARRSGITALDTRPYKVMVQPDLEKYNPYSPDRTQGFWLGCDQGAKDRVSEMKPHIEEYRKLVAEAKKAEEDSKDQQKEKEIVKVEE